MINKYNFIHFGLAHFCIRAVPIFLCRSRQSSVVSYSRCCCILIIRTVLACARTWNVKAFEVTSVVAFESHFQQFKSC